MSSGFEQLLKILWAVIPAYIANGSPVLGSKILESLKIKRHPIDGGRNFIDGKRVFGDNKTWEGLLIGISMGFLAGFVQAVLSNEYLYIIRGFVLSIGAVVGDLIGSFIKRRLGLKPGDLLPVLDQIFFLIIALAIAIGVKTIYMTLEQFLFLIIITATLHILTNYVAYRLGLKKVPW